MERRTAQAEPRPPRRRKKAAAALPDDDRFAPHPGETIDPVYVIARAMELILARPLAVLGVMLASVVVSAIVLLPLVSFDVLGAVGLDEPMHPANLTLMLLLAWASALLLQTPLVGSAIEIHTTRRGLFLEFLRRGTATLPVLMVASLAVLGLVVLSMAVAGGVVVAWIEVTGLVPWVFVTLMLRFAGTVVISVLAMRLVAAFSLVVPIVVVERLAPGPALRRSWALGWPNSFPILVALGLPALLVQVLLFLTSFMPGIVTVVAVIVFGLALALYQSVVAPVAYVAIREYVDGIDPARLLTRNR